MSAHFCKLFIVLFLRFADALRVTNDQMLEQSQREEEESRRELRRDLLRYRDTYQRTEDSRDADLACNRQGALELNLSIPESQLGPASMTVFKVWWCWIGCTHFNVFNVVFKPLRITWSTYCFWVWLGRGPGGEWAEKSSNGREWATAESSERGHRKTAPLAETSRWMQKCSWRFSHLSHTLSLLQWNFLLPLWSP